MLLQHLLEVPARMAGGVLCHRFRAHHHDLVLLESGTTSTVISFARQSLIRSAVVLNTFKILKYSQNFYPLF